MTKDHQTDTDDLVERLEDSKGWPNLGKAAAARIRLDAEIIKAAEEMAKVLEDGQKVENWSFSAGTEEREGGSGRRQGKELDRVRDWQERRISALDAFHRAMRGRKGGE